MPARFFIKFQYMLHTPAKKIWLLCYFNLWITFSNKTINHLLSARENAKYTSSVMTESTLIDILASVLPYNNNEIISKKVVLCIVTLIV